MTRFAVAVTILIVLTVGSACAQDSTPKVQVFGGYSLVDADTGGLTGSKVDAALGQPVNTFGVSSIFRGWNAEAQYNFDGWVGLAVDFSGRSGKPFTSRSATPVTGIPNETAYSILVGPVLSYRTKSKLTPFAHALFGYDRTHLGASTIVGPSSTVASASSSYTDFAMALGGGVDYKISRNFLLRLGQVDYFHTSINLNTLYDGAFGTAAIEGLATRQRNIRFSTGIVVRF
jgi:opacity protein-like surface antigen